MSGGIWRYISTQGVSDDEVIYVHQMVQRSLVSVKIGMSVNVFKHFVVQAN